MAISCPLGGLLSDMLTRGAGRRVGRCGCRLLCDALAAVFLASARGVDKRTTRKYRSCRRRRRFVLCRRVPLVGERRQGGSFSGSVSGFMNMGAQPAARSTASLTPWIAAHYGWTASFLVAAALCGAGGLLGYGRPRKQASRGALIDSHLKTPREDLRCRPKFYLQRHTRPHCNRKYRWIEFAHINRFNP